MHGKRVRGLIAKYLTGQASGEELALLTELLKDSDNLLLFNEFVRVHYAIDHTMKKYDINKAKKELLKEIRRDKRILRGTQIRTFLKYAAVAAVFLGLGYFYKQGAWTVSGTDHLVPREEAITLELENGAIKVIDPSDTMEFRDSEGNLIGSQTGNTISYKGSDKRNKLIYNTLKVPYGKRFDVRLSDGTLVSLNAGSSLKYPIQFMDDLDRQVYLTGEAYFDVAENPQLPFHVTASSLTVEVLGTEFGVAAYPEDNTAEVVLVRGSVAMQSGTARSRLVPGQRGSMDKMSDSIKVERVNTNLYTAWRNGELVFRQMPLDNILIKLERHYNITIINRNEALGREVFNASFKNEPIEKVLGYLNTFYGIDYTIQDNKVIIN